MKILTSVTLSIAAVLCLGISASAAPPDLTNGGVATGTNTTNLGPTGMRGWAYNVNTSTSQSRQIKVTTVDAGSPAAGMLAVNDVILGANGTGAEPVNFISDARKSLGLAIADAEARNPATLKLIRWRAGTTATVQITLQSMGAYSPTAPYNCPKSALILEQGLQTLMTSGSAGNFSLGTLALLAGNNPANPNNAARQARAQAEARAMIPNAALMALMNSDDQIETTDKVVWLRGHQLIVLAEYYLQSGDSLVLPAIQAMAKSISKGQSLFGTMGHLFADKWEDGSLNGPMGGVYGPVNSAGLPTFYGLLLAKQCGVNTPQLDSAIARASRFYAYYAGRGSIPYGEHDTGRNSYESNGKNGLAALAFSLQGNRNDESKFFSKMAASSGPEREIGHTGPFFNLMWAPLGANIGGEAAVESYFSQTRWLYDLARRWDGSFVYESIETGGPGSYGSFNASTPFLLTYALPLHQLMITGKNANPAVLLSGADIADVAAAPQYVAAARTTSQLVADLGSWSTAIQTQAVAELKLRPSEHAALLPTLHALASDVTGTSRVGACWALGKIASGSSATTLAAILADPDNKVRHAAAENLRYLPQANKMAVLSSILTAAASTAKPLLPLDEEDPIHMAHGRLGMLLFYSGNAYGPKGVIWGSGINGVDRNPLYPAIRAIATNPLGQVRSTLTETYSNLSPTDFQSLADVIVDTVRYRAPADKMFSQGIRQRGLELLQTKGYAEGVPLAMIYEKNDGRNSVTTDVLGVLQSYAGSSPTVVPNPEVVTYLNSFLNDQSHVAEVQAVLDAIAADTNPAPLTPLKSISAVTADAPVLTLPVKYTVLRANATDLAKGDSIYTWRKVHGAGDVTFTPNGTGDAKNTTILFDGIPGQYLFEVKMSDSRNFTEVYKTVAVTLKNSDGTLPANTPPTADSQTLTFPQAAPAPITLSGSDPEGYALNYAVTVKPTHGKLSGTAPYLVYTSNFDFSGPDSLIFKVTDSEGQVSSATVNITVNAGINVPVAIYEPFAQATGQLVGKPGGIGFSGNWTGSDATRTSVVAGNLSFGSLPTSGNRITTSASNGNLSISTGTTLSNAGLMANGAELWFSFLHVNPNNSNISPTWVLGNQIVTGAATIASSGSGIGVKVSKGNAPQAMIFDAGTQLTSDSQSLIAPSATALIVGHIIWGADAGSPDTIEIYTPGTDLVLDTPQTISAVLDQSAFNKFSIFGNAAAPNMDEFRFGPSYHSVLVGNTALTADVNPPVPNPMGFDSGPTVSGPTSISMTAATAFDASGIEYYFACTAGGGHDSGWQAGTSYIDTSLTPGIQYSYTVKSRDKSPAHNVTTPSAASSATIASQNTTQATVPTVTGMIQSTAQSIISATGLTVATVTNSYSDTFTAGTVISQNPSGESIVNLDVPVSLVVSLGMDPTQPPTIFSNQIVDDKGGISSVVNMVVNYTLTFSKDMDASTVGVDDFSNAGTSLIAIGTITKIAPGVFTVQVTPTSLGTLQLQIPAGANLESVFNVPLDTSSAINDDTTVMVTSSGGIDALVYEPFDYPVGALAGWSGGTGMAGAWSNGPENPGVAGIFDQTTGTTPADRGSGLLSWDGVVDNLPSLPAPGASYVAVLNSAGDKWEAYRALAEDAGTMAGAGKVLWASMAWHKAGSGFGQHVGFALTTDSFKERGTKLDTSGNYGSGAGDGIGVAESTFANDMYKGKYSAAVFDNGSRTAIQTSAIQAAGDYVLVLKFEFGAIDTVSVYAFPESDTLSEANFNIHKISASAALDESTLNKVAFSNVRGEPAFDEIRFGRTFASIMGSATIPDLVGLSQATAEAKLVTGKLLVGTVTTQNSTEISAGMVISQTPVAGTSVIQGAVVNLVISVGSVTTPVPDGVGLVQAIAQTNIIAANLTVGTISIAYSDTVPAGSVISQNPTGGSDAPLGSNVDLVVSLGPVMVNVPNVVGLEGTPAEASIEAANLVLGTTTGQYDAEVPTGYVISQNPSGGSSVVEGTAVDRVVSLGPPLTMVPDVTGLAQTNAEANIIAVGLAVGTISTQYDAVVPVGNVISQNPSGDANVNQGSSVNLVVSLGYVATSVPNVVGLVQATAASNILAANLRVGTVTPQSNDTVPMGTVISQNPPGGTTIMRDSEVSFVVSLGDQTAPMPATMTWASAPAASGPTSITMTATTATDANGVEYYFTCTAGGGHSSAWQNSATYSDTGLSPNTQYTYAVQARDQATPPNANIASSPSSATTEATAAGIITWGAATNITGLVSDVSTTGTLVAGSALTGTIDTSKNVTVNTVPFVAGLIWSGATSLASSGRVTATVGTATMDSNYRILLLSESYQNALNTITLSGLISGQQYQIQVWVSDAAQTAAKTSTVLDGTRAVYWEAGATEGTWGQYVIGTFIANAATQTFTAQSYDFFGGMNYLGGAGTQATRNTFLGGIQVRKLPAAPVPPYNTWAAIYSPADLSDLHADNDHDGLTNFNEYAFGLNPTQGSSANPISVPLDKAVGTFFYTRRTQSLTGLNYTIRSSTSLATDNWNPLVKDTDYTELVTDTSGDVETVKVTLASGLLTAPKLFVQVGAAD